MCGDHNRSRCYLFKEKLFEQYRLQHCPWAILVHC
jgi:hypothetical protein